jgi:pro-apoptotic serine protease NMA111
MSDPSSQEPEAKPRSMPAMSPATNIPNPSFPPAVNPSLPSMSLSPTAISPSVDFPSISPTAPVPQPVAFEPPMRESTIQIVEYSAVVDQDDQSLDPWGRVLQRVIKAIVSIRGTRMRTFDTEGSGSFMGTGFVVDRERGIILSNRHIVGQGPSTATAIFGNYEEINLQQDYIDPVHDFGFFRYDTSKIKFAEVEEIELYPQGAKVGLDIKVCGNDAGEKLSILSSTLSRLDRAAPYLGIGYNDFNINYFQAASGTSPGSSGSPVLDVKGHAIALNASGSVSSAAAFFLPLEPVVRALKFVQQGQNVPRGTIQTHFVHMPYDELRRVGVPEEVEKHCREINPTGTGLLSVARIVPEGPGSVAGLSVVDILVECYHKRYGHRFISSFHSLWDIIDNCIDDDIVLTVYRGAEKRELKVKVQDLHSITPNTFIEIGDAVIHQLSYQYARVTHSPCRGLYVACSGIFGWAGGGNFLITEMADIRVDTLDNFLKLYLSLEDGKKVSFRYMPLGGSEEHLGLVEIDHHFYLSALYTKTKTWTRKVLSPTFSAEPERLHRTPTMRLAVSRADRVRQTLVMVRCRMPYSVDVLSLLCSRSDYQGIATPANYMGVGVLVAVHPFPMIVVSRAFVPIAICDISVIIGKRTVPGRLVYVGLVVIITIESKSVSPLLELPKVSEKEYTVGDSVEIFGLTASLQLMQRKTVLHSVTSIVCPPRNPPIWRIVNTEGYVFQEAPSVLGGVVIDPADDSLLSIYLCVDGASYYVGLDYRYYVKPLIDSLCAGEPVKSWCSGWDYAYINLIKAMDLGMPEHHANRLDEMSKTIGTAPQAIWVQGKLRPTCKDLEIGDFVLEINGEPVSRMADLRVLYQSETSTVRVLRNRQEMEIVIHGTLLPSATTSRVICWAGATVQATPPTALEQTTPEFIRLAEQEGITDLESLVYISALYSGSPAQTALQPTLWIVEIADQKVRSLSDLEEVIKSLRENDEQEEYIRVKMRGKEGITAVMPLKLNSHFWPTWTLVLSEDKWVKKELE